MIQQFTSLASRILFVAAFVLAGLAVVEKVVNVLGYTLLRSYAPYRLLELASSGLYLIRAHVDKTEYQSTSKQDVAQICPPRAIPGR